MKNLLIKLSKFGVIVLFLFFTIRSASEESLTFDEIFNLQEGLTNVTTRTFPIEPYNPPLIRELAVLPTIFGITPDVGVPNQKYHINRLVIVLFAVILLWQVMKVSYEYFGYWPSIFSGVLLSLEPTMLAHSHYITPDMGLTLFVFLAYKAFLNILISPTMTRYFFFGIFFGLAAASKISALPFLTLSFLIVYSMKRKTFPLEWHMDHAGNTVFSLIVAAFVVWSTYFFRMTPILIKHDDPNRLSNKILMYANQKQLTIITQGIQLLQGTPFPLGDYLGILKNNVLRATEKQRVFHMGTYYSHVGWYMMPQILLAKLPLPFLIFVFVGTLLLVLPEKIIKYITNFEEKFKKTEYARKESENMEREVLDTYDTVPRYKMHVQYEERMDKEWNYLFIIPVFSIFFIAICTGMNPLVRYILPAFPFLAIIAGSAVQTVQSTWKKILILVLLFWLAYTTYQSYPHFITYTNEFIPEKERYLYMQDSNLDWGQSLISSKEYINKKQPSQLLFSYFGRDDASEYGFVSDLVWGSHKNNEICAFHPMSNFRNKGDTLTAISVTNWYVCGYHLMPEYHKNNIQDIVADSILIF